MLQKRKVLGRQQMSMQICLRPSLSGKLALQGHAVKAHVASNDSKKSRSGQQKSAMLCSCLQTHAPYKMAAEHPIRQFDGHMDRKHARDKVQLSL